MTLDLSVNPRNFSVWKEKKCVFYKLMDNLEYAINPRPNRFSEKKIIVRYVELESQTVITVHVCLTM